MDALIRRAGPGDLDRLLGLVRACFEEGWGAASLAGALSAGEARAWIAVEADRASPTAEPAAIGFVLARRILDLLEIDLVGVRPDARRLGLAGDLLETLLATEARTGLVEARLELSTANEPASRLYAGLGFVVVGRRPRYYPDGTDALLLSRSLGGPI